MSDETTQENPTEEQDTTPSQAQNSDIPATWEEIFEHNRFKQLTERAKEAEMALDKLKSEREDQRQKELEEQEKWRELAGERQSKIEELQPIQEQYNAMLERLRESNKQRIESIPEAMRSLVPEYDDPSRLAAWLDANASKLAKQPAPDLNGGAGSGERPGAEVKLSDAEIQTAKKMGVSIEAYKKRKAELQGA
jgi:DNA repair exonuclease SbcCD ATPase subunit